MTIGQIRSECINVRVMVMVQRVVASRFRLQSKIGSGSFGDIYAAEATVSGALCAVKIEKAGSAIRALETEAKIYKRLSGGTGIPKIYFFGKEGNRDVMAIDLLGPSLEELLVRCGGIFSLKTVLMIVDQMLTCIEYIHTKGCVHRDLKPENFVIGREKAENQMYIIDFGLAKRYRSEGSSHKHCEYSDEQGFTGTARFASVGAHRGIEGTRRDDLESLGFLWLYLLRGSLPWMSGAKATRGGKRSVAETKARMSIDELCRGIPREFGLYLRTVRALGFSDQPNYSVLRAMFRGLFIREQFSYDYRYDWTLPRRVLAPPRNVVTQRPTPRRTPQISRGATPQVPRGATPHVSGRGTPCVGRCGTPGVNKRGVGKPRAPRHRVKQCWEQ